MGAIISRFRSKKSTEEILENLETNIRNIERDEQDKQQTHKRIMGYVLVYSIVLYVVFAILYYYMYVGRSHHWVHSMMYASPLLLLPMLVIFLRSGISWYYNWTLDKNKLKLRRMREQKKKILEDVMNTETYKVAKEILDKYGSSTENKLRPFVPTTNVPGNCSPDPFRGTPGQMLQRKMGQALSPIPFKQNQLLPLTSTPLSNNRIQPSQLPRPLPPLQRSTFDKFVDYLLQDGPNNRMALICGQCYAHNGMAIPEEFEYLTYVCAYCSHKNMARKRRPTPPPLNTSPMSAINNTAHNLTPFPHSSEESSSDSDKIESDRDEYFEQTLLEEPEAEISPKSPEEKKID